MLSKQKAYLRQCLDVQQTSTKIDNIHEDVFVPNLFCLLKIFYFT